MVIINPKPLSFTSTAKNDIYSENTRTDITTEQVVASAKNIHELFQRKGYYTAIKESKLFTQGNADVI